jgi:hypothetical protein
MKTSGFRGCCAPGTSSVTCSRLLLYSLLATVAMLICFADIAQACPNCKDGIAATGSAEATAIARGYALSILIMLAMPFTLVGSFGLYVWREMRRLERDGRALPDGRSPAAATPPGGAAPSVDQTSWARPTSAN